MNDIAFYLTVCLGALIIITGILVGVQQGKNVIRTKAAQTECAQYNPLTGNFEWKEDK